MHCSSGFETSGHTMNCPESACIFFRSEHHRKKDDKPDTYNAEPLSTVPEYWKLSVMHFSKINEFWHPSCNILAKRQVGKYNEFWRAARFQ